MTVFGLSSDGSMETQRMSGSQTTTEKRAMIPKRRRPAHPGKILLEEFLKNVSHQAEERCRYCYSVRLEATAQEAKKRGFERFSTTLLQSTHQDHTLIKETGERIAHEIGIPFYYDDFRLGWRKGVEVSKTMGLYRQQYCGCVYSEKERYLQKVKGQK